MSYKKYVSEADLNPLQEKTKNLQEGGYGFETPWKITFDGNLADDAALIWEMFVLVSERIPESIQGVTATGEKNGEIFTQTFEGEPIINEDGYIAYEIEGQEMPITVGVIIYDESEGLQPGLYAVYVEQDSVKSWTSEFICNDIIHTIDPKYLPETYATKDELDTLSSQISSLNTLLENTLEGAES